MVLYLHYKNKIFSMGLFTFNITNANFNKKELEKIYKLLFTNNLKIDKLMASIQDLNAKLDELQASLDAEQQQILDAIAALEQTIADLQAIVEEGGTEAERQALLDKMDDIKADLEATIPDEE